MITLGRRFMCFSHGFSFQVELIGVVDEPVENGVGEGRVCDDGMPFLHGELRATPCTA